MLTYEAHRRINRPPEAVFDLIGTNVYDNHPSWESEVVEIRPLTDPPVQLGSRAIMVRREYGRRSEVAYEVTEFELNRKIGFRHVDGPMAFEIAFLLEASGEAARPDGSDSSAAKGSVSPLDAAHRAVASEDQRAHHEPDGRLRGAASCGRTSSVTEARAILEGRGGRVVPGVAALAIGIGGVIAASVASIVTFYAMGARGPIGPLNDALNAAAAAMTSLLAFSLHRQHIGRTRSGVIAAVLGGGVAVAGSALVMTSRTGWLLAGLVSTVGFALLGIWLALFNRSLAAARFPVRLRRLGMVTGAIMSLGVILLPAIAARVDDAESAPWWVWAGFQGFLGTYVLYPFWVIWFGRFLRRDTHHWH